MKFNWSGYQVTYVHSNDRFDFQERGTDKILYGIDDIRQVSEIIIVSFSPLFSIRIFFLSDNS